MRWAPNSGASLIIEAKKLRKERVGDHGLVMLTDLIWRKYLVVDMEERRLAKTINDVSEGWLGKGNAVVRQVAPRTCLSPLISGRLFGIGS